MQLTLQSEGTRSALRMLMQFSAATVQHYAQRTLMNLFCNWPADQGMDGFGSQKEVDFVIQVRIPGVRRLSVVPVVPVMWCVFIFCLCVCVCANVRKAGGAVMTWFVI